MGSRDLWRDSSFSGREGRSISGRKSKQHIHNFYTYKKDSNNGKESDIATHCRDHSGHSLEATPRSSRQAL